MNQDVEVAVYDNTISARTYLSYISEQAGGFACIGRDGKLYIKAIGEDIAELPIKYFQDFKWGEKFKISRVRYEDGIQLFEAGDETNNTIYINQENMYIVNQEQIDNIYNTLNGLEIYSFEGNSIIDPALDVGDLLLIDGKYVIYQGSSQYGGKFKANISSKIQCKSKEETTTRIPSQKTINRRVESRINQVEGSIEQTISEVDDQNQKISKVTQTVNELNSKISDIADITVSKESTNGIVEFEKINQSEPIRVVIHPIGTNISYLYPMGKRITADGEIIGLFPSSDLYLPNRRLRFTNITTNEYVDYELPIDLLYCDAENYDEFILDYDAQSCVVNKRVGYNADGTTYPLETPTTIEYEYPRIELEDGDYTVELLCYSNAYLFVRLMAQNIYTTQFATKAEVNSEISQTAQEIGLSVEKKLESYPTTTQMNSAISVKANEITSNVSKTYATKTELTTTKSEIRQTTDSISSEVSKKVGNDEIISKINQSSEAVGINANKIELSANDVLNLLAGNTINLSSKNITITSEKMTIDKYGRFIIYDTGQDGDSSFSVYYKNTENGMSVRPHMLEQHVSQGDAFFSYDTIEARHNSNGNHFWFSGLDDYFVFLLKYGATDVNPIYITDSISRFCDANGNTKLYLQNNGAFIQGNGLYVNGYQVLTNTSDKKLKKNIKDASINALEKIKQIRHRQFDWKKDDIHQNIGYIAQELEEIDSNYVHKDAKFDENGKLTSEYNYQVNILPMLATATKAIQEQQEQIENQNNLINKLQEQIELLQNEIKILKGEK